MWNFHEAFSTDSALLFHLYLNKWKWLKDGKDMISPPSKDSRQEIRKSMKERKPQSLQIQRLRIRHLAEVPSHSLLKDDMRIRKALLHSSLIRRLPMIRPYMPSGTWSMVIHTMHMMRLAFLHGKQRSKNQAPIQRTALSSTTYHLQPNGLRL